MKIHYESRLCDWLPEGTVAFTFGENIYCANAVAALPTLLHESWHVLQFRMYGKVGFTVRFFFWCLRYGYWNNPLEVEARAFAARRMKECSLAENWAYLQSL